MHWAGERLEMRRQHAGLPVAALRPWQVAESLLKCLRFAAEVRHLDEELKIERK